MHAPAWSRTPPYTRGVPRGWVLLSLATTLVLVLAAVGTLGQLWHRIDPRGPDVVDQAEIPGAFLYQQERSLSCEYASAHIGATMLGYHVSEYDIEAVIPHNENPHLGYRGNILGTWGNTDDYGIYNEPLADGLAALGIRAIPWYGGPDDLRARLNAGEPTVVWLGMRGEGYSTDHSDAAGRHYQLTVYMHVMLAYAYDGSSVYLTDPGTAVWRTYRWADFTDMWSVMDGMALSLAG